MDIEYKGFTIRRAGGVHLVLSITTDPQGKPDEFCRGQFPVTGDDDQGLPAVKSWIDILADQSV